MELIVLIQLIVNMVMFLLAVAFFSLFERKVLSLISVRLGPNKVGFAGILQPFGDALKLLSKVDSNPVESIGFLYVISPILMISMLLSVWASYPYFSMVFSFSSSILFILVCFGISSYGVIFAGWCSSSKYALIGSIRAISQSISYEISMSFSFLFFSILAGSFSLLEVISMNKDLLVVFSMSIMTAILLISFLSESGRSPFDLPESESELVSGYNVEYGGVSYTMMFLSENLSSLFSAFFLTKMFFGSFFMVELMIFSIFFFLLVWIRGTEPRVRYDLMMKMCWMKLIPITLLSMLAYSLLLI